MTNEADDAEAGPVPAARPRQASAAERGFVVVPIFFKGKRTCVSVDDRLWAVLVDLEGDARRARAWVAEEVALIEQLMGTAAGVGLAETPSVSRLVHRRVYDRIRVALAGLRK